VNYGLDDFLLYFPEAELPINISSEYMGMFGQINIPVPEDLIKEYLLDNDPESLYQDGLEIEYIPCFQLPGGKNFKAIVYLKISLMNYEYFLHTFDNAGRTISVKMIATMSSDGNQIKEKTAMIDENNVVWTLEGVSSSHMDFDPSDSLFIGFFIDEKGKIIEK